VDFLCVSTSDDSEWDVYAVEIKPRLTGTTHPWMTLKMLTHGHADPGTGEFVTPMGQQKCYVSSDHVCDESFKKLVPQDLYKLMTARKYLHWSHLRQTGVIFHMIGRILECGIISMTSIGNSLEEARELLNSISLA
jgi:hypothetical protein